MADWRDTASQQAQDDLDRLFNAAIDRATGLLAGDDRFVPFANAVGGDGAIDVLPAPEGESGSARAVLDRLYAAARQRAVDYRAVAFTAIITFEQRPAVRIEAEHRDGIALALRVPFRRRFLGGLRLGSMRLAEGPVRVWRRTGTSPT